MKKIKFTVLTLYVIAFSLVSTPLLAQDPDFPIDNDPGNAPAAPIDDWVLPMFILTLLLVYFMHRKHNLNRVK
ncbi:hypothetical protein FBBAL38_08829 [Flavobacteria bacterium BAL38]|nr:hypothetical protein FBBAL38_08829 [Flavobacteria bacterium BAL38]MDP5027509.1 hypothetical protein [Flavobacterium sp.]